MRNARLKIVAATCPFIFSVFSYADNVQPQAQVAPTAGAADVSAAPMTDQVPPPGTSLPGLPKLPKVGDASYREVVDQAAPLSPRQIKKLRKKVDDSERAASALPRFVPRPVSSQVTVSLAPGETPPVVRLFANNVTNILFMDMGGNPLNVTDVDPGGGPSLFTITYNQNAKEGSNLVKISPKSNYVYGNVSVSLDGVIVPVSITLVSAQREVDSRVDVRVKTASRQLSARGGMTLPNGIDPLLQGLLQGIVPDNAKNLMTSSNEVQAWSYNGHFYIRTGFTLLSPAYISVQKSSDGSAAYEIPQSPVILILAGGGTTQINISGY